MIQSAGLVLDAKVDTQRISFPGGWGGGGVGGGTWQNSNILPAVTSPEVSCHTYNILISNLYNTHTSNFMNISVQTICNI